MPKLKSTLGSDFKAYRSVRQGSARDPLPDGVTDMDAALERSSPNPEPARYTNDIGCKDPLFYIYTSGTTGLPKPVIIKHLRQMTVCLAVPVTAGMTPDDVMYCYLPLYHSSGSQVGTGAAFLLGSTTVIKRKFSASGFWKDCVKYNVTVRAH